MLDKKSMIKEIIKLENWSHFEEFIHSLYKNNKNVLKSEINYRRNGKSGRKREVDVYVELGLDPHIIKLGIECKFWKNKVDGDVIDVVKNKKDDLGFDKFVIITTEGYERGAKKYAEANNIDIFVIRPTTDDDFGYAGKVIKVNLDIMSSSVENFHINAQVISNNPNIDQEYFSNRVNEVTLSKDDNCLDTNLDMYNIVEVLNGEIRYIQKLKKKENMLKTIERFRMNATKKLYENKGVSFKQKIKFKNPTALFMENDSIVILKEIDFSIRFFRSISKFEVNRGDQYPVVIQNIISDSITPIKNKENEYEMGKSFYVEPIDLENVPEDVVGRDGINLKILLNQQMDIKKRKLDEKTYELIHKNNKAIWEKI